MAFQLTLPTLLGIIIGGVAFFFCLAVAVVVTCLRIKHRRQLERTNAAGERRLSHFPGGHLSITDEDIVQMPGTGAAMRNSLCSRYTRASAYAPMESRESLEKQSSKNMILSMPRFEPLTLPNGTVVTDPAPVSNSPIRSWPLPRRLTRANRPPAIDLQLPPSPNAVDTPQALETGRVKQESAEKAKCVPRDEISTRSPHLPYESQNVLGACPGKPASSSPNLRPKPLFHEKQRSISYGMIPYIDGQKRSGSAHGGQESQKPPANFSAPPLPRSISLASQGPGSIPIGPIPPLPAEALVIRRQRSRKASGSRQSLVAAPLRQNFDGTSDIDSSPIKAIAQTPVKFSKNPANHLRKDLSMADGKIHPPPASPTVVRVGTLKAPLDSRKSFQASIQDSITRSNSSGLSESLLNHGWSRPVSNASMLKEISHARTKAPATSNIGAHISVFDFGLPLRADLDIGALSQRNSDDLQVKRKSASILRAISGNEQNPGLDLEEERPISIATEIPHRWSPDVLAKEMGNDDETVNGSIKARHKYKRLSKQPYTPTSRSSRIYGNVQKTKLSRAPPQSEVQTLRRPRVDPPAFRPPSKLTFDPQLTGTPHNKPLHPRNTPSPIPYLKSTLAILTAHDDSDSSSSSPPPTPTRKPSQKRQPSGTHPNRQRAIFDGPSKIVQWPIVGQHTALFRGLSASNDESPEKANNVFRLDEQLNGTQNIVNKAASPEDEGGNRATSNRPLSLLYRFPSPPSPSLRKVSDSGCGGNLKFPSTLQSYSQPVIQNPRPDKSISPSYGDAHSKTTSSLNARTGDSRRPGEGVNKSPSDQLRQSVLALRRMNSEVSESSRAGREHRRYLSLGQKEEAIFEDGDDGGDFSSVVRRMESTSSVTTVLGAHAPVSPSSDRKKEEAEREKEKGRKPVVRGPRAMPGWLDESMMSSSTSYAPNVAEAEQTSRNWFEGEEFSKLF